jgi:myo-inositol-1-phosphate synthase
MIYAYAALKCHVPFVNGAPNLSVDLPALVQLAETNGIPVAGKDLKTGQSLIKTVLASGI